MITLIAHRLRGVALLLGLCLASPLWAQVQAKIDRNPVDLGESFTLTIATTHANASPDLTPLMADFDLVDQSSRRSVQIVNGQSSSQTIFELVLEPKRAGNLRIPELLVGGERMLPIPLTVRPAAPMGTRAGNADLFLETEVDDSRPYVQQSVGVTLRLFYAVPLVSGVITQDPPDGAMLQKVGEDVQGSSDLNGRRYNWVERRYLLVPERSGALALPGPRFKGRGAGGWFDDLMGGNGRELRAAGPARTLTVRAQPAQAAQPWLPLRDLRLRYVSAPSSLAAGGSATVTVEGVALGATQAQLPQIPAPVIAGAQVFAEPVQYDETFVNGTPQVKWTQRYAVVPDQPGRLLLRGLRVPWWDVQSGQARVASLPDLPLQVDATGVANPSLPAAAAPSRPTAGVAGDALSMPVSHAAGASNTWRWIAVGFAALWLITLLWALRHRATKRVPATPEPGPRHPSHAGVRSRVELKRALDTGSLDEVAEILRAMASPPARDLDDLMSRLASGEQRDALDALRRARWADGDGTAARAALRRAFAEGPRWRESANVHREPLPPLYPET